MNWTVAEIVAYLARYDIRVVVSQGISRLHPPKNLPHLDEILATVMPHVRNKREELIKFFDPDYYPPALTPLQAQAKRDVDSKRPVEYHNYTSERSKALARMIERSGGRPIWYLMPDGLAVPYATERNHKARGIPPRATHIAAIGDAIWERLPPARRKIKGTRIATDAAKTQAS